MIIQSAPQGKGHLVIQQKEHAMLAARFAQSWGNDNFSELHPKSLMEFIVEHHDEGWNAIDPKLGINEETGLPYNLIQTPFEYLMETGPKGPNYAEMKHAYCGLLVSMHTYGLYNGRYGLSDKIFVNLLPEDKKNIANTMLSAELDRQDRLKEILAQDEYFSSLVQDTELFHNYKLLQFFDTLSLYFNMNHDEEREDTHFLNVPMKVGEDTTISIKRISKGLYGLSPFPFKKQPIEFHFDGKRILPQSNEDDLKTALNGTHLERETILCISL